MILLNSMIKGGVCINCLETVSFLDLDDDHGSLESAGRGVRSVRATNKWQASLFINAQNQILVEGDITAVDQLKEITKSFIANP